MYLIADDAKKNYWIGLMSPRVVGSEKKVLFGVTSNLFEKVTSPAMKYIHETYVPVLVAFGKQNPASDDVETAQRMLNSFGSHVELWL